MKRLVALLGFTFFLLFPTSVAAAECQFVLGFKTIRDLIGHEIVGECLESERYNHIGDSVQQTTGGLLVWRKADNWTAFTDGFRSWVNGPNGLEKRLNTQRFDWEIDYSPLTSVVPSARAPTPALAPDRSLSDLARAAPWYRDGLNHDHPSFPEPRAVRAFTRIDNRNPELARQMSTWTWMFDEDMRTNEVSVIEYIAGINEKFPWFVPYLADLPWIQDGVTAWETRTASNIYQAAVHYDLDFALELATAPWVVDGVSVLEAYEGTTNLSEMAGNSQMAHASPALASRALSFVNYPPTEIDFYLLKGIQTIHWLLPDDFERLLTESWFVDGLDERERIYLIAAAGSGLEAEQLLQPYHIASASITLPHAGVVHLWVVRRQPFPPGHAVLANLEEAVRASEEFWRLPFPVDHVILSLLPGAGVRGAHLGHMMVLGTRQGGLASAPYHEVAHYYFNAGPTWFVEGGAELIQPYRTNGGNIPQLDFPEYCREQGVTNLNAFIELSGGGAWDRCRYPMGFHFLVALREAMGDEPWRSALRDLFLDAGYLGLYLASENFEDEEIYRVFLEHTPPQLVTAVKDVFRRLHGGSFVDR